MIQQDMGPLDEHLRNAWVLSRLEERSDAADEALQTALPPLFEAELARGTPSMWGFTEAGMSRLRELGYAAE